LRILDQAAADNSRAHRGPSIKPFTKRPLSAAAL
jgi:hypothetical protein